VEWTAWELECKRRDLVFPMVFHCRPLSIIASLDNAQNYNTSLTAKQPYGGTRTTYNSYRPSSRPCTRPCTRPSTRPSTSIVLSFFFLFLASNEGQMVFRTVGERCDSHFSRVATATTRPRSTPRHPVRPNKPSHHPVSPVPATV
jgi:hypothetical protein